MGAWKEMRKQRGDGEEGCKGRRKKRSREGNTWRGCKNEVRRGRGAEMEMAKHGGVGGKKGGGRSRE